MKNYFCSFSNTLGSHCTNNHKWHTPIGKKNQQSSYQNVSLSLKSFTLYLLKKHSDFGHRLYIILAHVKILSKINWLIYSWNILHFWITSNPIILLHYFNSVASRMLGMPVAFLKNTSEILFQVTDAHFASLNVHYFLLGMWQTILSKDLS